MLKEGAWCDIINMICFKRMFLSNLRKDRVIIMNFRQLQYAVILSESQNISSAADKLNITQPALSKQILSLEKEIGVTLFDRDSVPLTLTAAGECFIKEAKELLFKEEKLRHSMEDYKFGAKAKLTIGISPFRAAYFLSDIIEELQEKYDGLQIVLREFFSSQLQKEAIEGLVDFAIINLPVDNALLDVIPLKPEPLVLVVPKKYVDDISFIGSKNKTGFDSVSLNNCGEIPFIVLGKNQELRKLFDKLCTTSEFTPNITTEVVGIITAWNLCLAGVGATILPYNMMSGKIDSDKVAIFKIKNTASTRKPAIVMSKNQHISKYAKEAIELIRNKN